MTYADVYTALAAIVPADASFSLSVETWRHVYRGASRIATAWSASVFAGESLLYTLRQSSPDALLAELRQRAAPAASTGLGSIGDAVIAADESEAAE